MFGCMPGRARKCLTPLWTLKQSKAADVRMYASPVWTLKRLMFGPEVCQARPKMLDPSVDAETVDVCRSPIA